MMMMMASFLAVYKNNIACCLRLMASLLKDCSDTARLSFTCKVRICYPKPIFISHLFTVALLQSLTTCVSNEPFKDHLPVTTIIGLVRTYTTHSQLPRYGRETILFQTQPVATPQPRRGPTLSSVPSDCGHSDIPSLLRPGKKQGLACRVHVWIGVERISVIAGNVGKPVGSVYLDWSGEAFGEVGAAHRDAYIECVGVHDNQDGGLKVGAVEDISCIVNSPRLFGGLEGCSEFHRVRLQR